MRAFLQNVVVKVDVHISMRNATTVVSNVMIDEDLVEVVAREKYPGES